MPIFFGMIDNFNSYTAGNQSLFFAFLLWTLAWKGWALWRAAGRNERWWFIALLVINTLGLLEILYLFVFSRESSELKPAEEAK